MRIVVSPIFLALFALACFAGQDEQTVRVVLSGKCWKLGSQLVTRGSTYSVLAEFVGTKDSGDLLLDCGNSGSFAYTCSKDRCQVPACSTAADGVTVHVIRQPESAGESKSGFSFLASLLRREPRPVAVLGVRGVGDPNDAVLLEQGRSIHWGPSLKGVSEGQYCFRLTSLPHDNSSDSIVFQLNWDRSSDPGGVGQVPNVAPGLYQLEKGATGAAGACTTSPESVPAWVLILGEPEFSRADQAWKNYAPDLRDLRTSGASSVLQTTIRHAVLAYLSEAK
jgi:hypothetical protein